VTFGPSDRWYEPPEPPGPCCTEGEDDPDHDVQACLDEQAEAAAEAKAERQREDREDALWITDELVLSREAIKERIRAALYNGRWLNTYQACAWYGYQQALAGNPA
jgi:hypothetical protein